MRRFPVGSIVAVLCVAILFVFASHPSQENANASMKAEVSAIENVAQSLAKSIEQQQAMNVKAAEADIALVDKMNELFSHVSQLQSNFGELRESVKLTSASLQNDGCTCGEKLADLQKQIDELKGKVASLEQAKTTANTSAAAAASSYGTATPTKSTASGGSTGSVRSTSGGSTGSIKPGGVAGPGMSGYTYYTDPSTGWLMRCYHDGVDSSVPSQGYVESAYPYSSQPFVSSSPVAQSSECYTDPITGQTVCPNRASASRSTSSTFFPRLRSRR